MARSPSSPALLRATISKRGTRPIRAPIVSACLIHLIACLVLPLIEPSGRPIRSAATTAPTITTSTRTTNHDRPSCLPPRIDDAQHRGDGTTRLDRPVIHWPPTHWPQTHRPPITGRPRCTPGVVSPPDPVRRRPVPSVGQRHQSVSAIMGPVPSRLPEPSSSDSRGGLAHAQSSTRGDRPLAEKHGRAHLGTRHHPRKNPRNAPDFHANTDRREKPGRHRRRLARRASPENPTVCPLRQGTRPQAG